LVREHTKPGLDSEWALDPQDVLLLGGTEGVSGPFRVATAAVFDRALDPAEVAALGGPGVNVRPASPNSAPVVSVISGPPADIATGALATVSLTASDADGDAVQMRVDWGGGRVSPWTSFAAPGEPHEITDNWMTPGTRTVRAQARDRNGATTSWVDLGQVTASHQPTPGRTDGVKVVCYNVWVHFAYRTRLNETAGWLRGQNADFIGLQELSNLSDGGLAALGITWGHPHAVVGREAGSTVGLTSRHPIEGFTRHTAGLHRPVIQATTGGYEVFVVHLAFGDLSMRLDDLAVLGPVIQTEIDAGKKVIVMGDFNSHMESDDSWLQGQTDLPSVLPAAHLRDGYFDFEVMSGFLGLGLSDVSTVPPGPDNITFPTLLREDYRPQSLQLSRSYRVDFILVDHSTAPRTTVWFPRDRIVDYTSDHYPVAALIAPEGVVPGDAFASWMAGFPGVADPAPFADADGDGLPNILEFILNGDPTVPGSATLPIGAAVPGGGMVFSFVRRAESKSSGRLVFQYGTNLGDWTEIEVPAASAGNVVIEADAPAVGQETVTITVDAAAAADGRLFGRLELVPE
jgi:endonuclease/exonuclease/phosphatase family metal-dependent hydrolase